MTNCPHHHHHHDDQESHPPAAAPMDPAAKSLTDALRVSFRLLGAIMVFVLIAFAFTGVQSVEPQERGIVKVFGRYVGVAQPGLAYNWPFPIGEIEIVPVREETMAIEDFWLHELPNQRTQELSERRAPRGGLRPGWDGMLISGDRNLLHVRLNVTYTVQDPMLVRLQVTNLEELIRTAVCNAAIRAASTRTADGILRTEKDAFLDDIEQVAEAGLRKLMGIEDPGVEGVAITDAFLAGQNALTVPLAALQAYNAEQQARTQKNQAISAAKGEAETIVNEAAGASYRALVGEPYEQFDAPTPEGDYDLIGQYNLARQTAREDEAGELLNRIEVVLLSTVTSGEASRIIAQARAEKTDRIEQARSRYQHFAELLGEFRKSPEFLIQRHWAGVREAILDSPEVEKIYIPPSDQTAVFRINRDPEITRQIERERLRTEQESR